MDGENRMRLLSELKRSLRWADVQDALEATVKQMGEAGGGRSSGFFRAFLLETLGDFTTLIPLYKEFHHIGVIPHAKMSRYRIVSLEKVIRLAKNSGGAKGDVSSFQSRNLSQNEYGGAILVIVEIEGEIFYLIFSFSGLPEKGDEALCLLVASKLPWPTKNWVKLAIIETSDNEIARALGI